MNQYKYKTYERNMIKNKDEAANRASYVKEIEMLAQKLAYASAAYEFVGLSQDEKILENEEVVLLGKEMFSLAKTLLEKPADAEAGLMDLRDRLKKHMDCLMVYNDRYSIYAKVISSLRAQFEEVTPDPAFDTEEFAEQVVNQLVKEKDNASLKTLMMEIISELPVRMTRIKFYEHISDGLSVYIGSDRSSLDDFLYTVRNAAGLYEPEGMQEFFPELAEYLKKFEDLDYAHISADDYATAAYTINECFSYLSMLIDLINVLATITNELLVIAMSKAEEDSESSVVSREILQKVMEAFCFEENVELIETLMDRLVMLEGVQEPLLEEMYEIEGSIDNLLHSNSYTEASEKKEEILRLRNLCELLSVNNYSDLNREDKPQGVCEKTDVAVEFAKLQNELDVRLRGVEKVVARAIMSRVLGYLPSNFSNVKNLKEYIIASLNGCSDPKERAVYAENILDTMYAYEEDDAYDEDEDAFEDEEDGTDAEA
ncbi:MAG: hypothetical protein J5757_01365 [Lachnospiraceae bacterium]|nr:hypothetical protein [Lachnospiraceae bacterium]